MGEWSAFFLLLNVLVPVAVAGALFGSIYLTKWMFEALWWLLVEMSKLVGGG
ncbi:hypothetical protein [Haloarchaeobius sp. TZWWS8]|uniref:hypothetical protein n=1 Tax=Haloarchaeobius sp. TZWWS8 TaxID=3446121 RepID=UPI003EBF573F